MKNFLSVLVISLASPTISFADVITFDFTGRLIVADPTGSILTNAGSTYTPIAASLTYDTLSGVGTSALSITMDEAWNGSIATFHDISMIHSPGSNTITGQVGVDWGGNFDMPLHIEWDATGLLNAIGYGLQAGDVLSGSTLYHDANGNGVQDPGEFLTDINSALPYSSSLEDTYYWNNFGILNPDLQGPAPLAATSNSLGLTSGPFQGIRGYFDIGSGNSMHVVSVSSVPVPAAVWLFGSGLMGLIAMGRRKSAA